MKGVVYLLTSIDTGKGYVGSTINLKDRLCRHRSEKRNNCTSKLLGPFECMILEEYIDDEITDKKEFKKQLRWLERNYQDLYKDDIVNEMRSQVTREEKKEAHKIINDKYYAENPEYYKKKSAKYQAEHFEQHKESCAKYRAEHSEEIKEKFNCECGGKYTYNNKSRHLKTKMHQEYIVTK